jgi:hypothetical protein
MGRRPLAGRDRKIIQGQRRDEFFKRMRRRGGTPRLPTQGMTTAVAEELEPVLSDTEGDESSLTTAEGGAAATDEAAPAASEVPAESPESVATAEDDTEPAASAR